MKIFHYLYFSFHFHLGDPPLAQEDYFPPKSVQHRHLLFKVKKVELINYTSRTTMDRRVREMLPFT